MVATMHIANTLKIQRFRLADTDTLSIGKKARLHRFFLLTPKLQFQNSNTAGFITPHK